MAIKYVKRCSTSLTIREMKAKRQRDVPLHPSGWLTVTRQVTSTGDDVEKRRSCTLLVGMQISIATMENTMEISQKIKNRATM